MLRAFRGLPSGRYPSGTHYVPPPIPARLFLLKSFFAAESNIMEEKEKRSAVRNLAILVLVMVVSAISGWIYELIFYRIALGRWINRGTSLGPWIPVYGFGGILMLLCCWPLRKHPLLVFFTGGAVAAVLEYFTGLFLLKVMNLRLWDYTTEPWNFLNLDGYVCFRSAAIFCVFALLLVYAVMPMLLSLEKRLKRRIFLCISFALGAVYAADVLFHAASGNFKLAPT